MILHTVSIKMLALSVFVSFVIGEESRHAFHQKQDGVKFDERINQARFSSYLF
jgi:hypothetical protein